MVADTPAKAEMLPVNTTEQLILAGVAAAPFVKFAVDETVLVIEAVLATLNEPEAVNVEVASIETSDDTVPFCRLAVAIVICPEPEPDMSARRSPEIDVLTWHAMEPNTKATRLNSALSTTPEVVIVLSM
jgi:hypothetical protein